MRKVIVFAGPTISRAEIEAVLDAECRPPVSQGDIFRAVRSGAEAIGIIDGYFNSTPAVWHKEILWAMSEGVSVFGAASMGALRAVELAAFGMRGVGWVYEAFATGRLEDDDEVAIVHAPVTANYRAMSEAMVNVRRTLEISVHERVLGEDQSAAIEKCAKELFYSDRIWPRILEEASAVLADDELASFRKWLPGGRVDVKCEDARAMLQAMRNFLEGCHDASDLIAEPTMQVGRFEATCLVERARQIAISEGEASSSPDTDSPGGRILDELRLLGQPWLDAKEAALLEALVLERAVMSTNALSESAMLDEIARFRVEHGLLEGSGLEGWLAERGLSEAELLSILSRGARVRQTRIEMNGLVSRLLLDRILVSAEYVSIVARMTDKKNVLNEAQERGVLAPCPLTLEELLDWYSRELSVEIGAPTDAKERETLLKTLRREYQYRLHGGKLALRP